MKIKLVDLGKDLTGKIGESGRPLASVSNVNIEIPDGKITGLIGPAHSGKSSLLYMIAGLYEITEGSLYFGNMDVTHIPPEKRNVGFVFQNYQLYPHLTALQNIMFPLLNNKEPKASAKEKAMKIAEIMGLTNILEKKPRVLDAHEKIQVAIARAFVKNPNVVLLDEPLANLDIMYRNETRDLIKKVQRETGITTIFVSHNQEDTIIISDYVAIMNDGSTKAFGTPSELYINPNSQFVAQFLGSPTINVIHGTYNDDEEGIKQEEEIKKEEEVEAESLESNLPVESLDVEEIETPSEIEEKNEDVIEAEVPKGVLKFGDQVFVDDKTPAFGERMILTKDTRIAVRPDEFDINPNGKYVMHIVKVDFTGRERLVTFTLPGIDYEFKCLVPLEQEITVDTDVKFNFKKYFIFDYIGRRIK